MRLASLCAVICVTITRPVAAQATHEHAAADAVTPRPCIARRAGEVSFANSGSRTAQPAFQRGMTLLHSFTYPEAADCFREAQRADPSFAMAYWGEALTYIHTAWRTEDPAASRAALARLAPTPEARLALAPTPRERAYGAAVEALVAEGIPEETRVRGFSDGMQAVVAANPNDVDAQAFAALGGLVVNYMWPPADSVARERAHDAAEALAMRVFREHPRHPGGVHYAIHVDDEPRYASRALGAALAYARVAPDADHAQHMPSHIFVQLGMWDDDVASNERSWAASRRRNVTRGVSAANSSFHSLHWLQYGYLQQGRIGRAAAMIDTARATLRGVSPDFDGSGDAQYAVNALSLRLAAETGDGWRQVIETAPTGPMADASQRAGSFSTASRYAVAVASAMLGDSAAARATAETFRREAGNAAMPAAPRRLRRLFAEQVDALVAQHRGDWPAATAAFTRAAAIEDTIPPIGPPTALVSHEWLGAALLHEGRPAEAAAAYQRALVLRPNRAQALLGLARARAAEGKPRPAAMAYQALAKAWHAADADRPGLAEARKGLKGARGER